ncbi:MAG: phosphate ABC transporter substrate-binding protein [Defluviitaleaceae bacterium]|nr:phosphate ABC transporter substrate-binding protein [Defluviitaleaceae bacterium]
MKKLLSMFGIMFLVACGNAAEPTTAEQPNTQPNPAPTVVEPSPEYTGLVGEIIVAGSTTVTPLMRELVSAFTNINGHVSIEVQELGTSSGINATINGVSDIAMASRTLSDSEQEQGLTPVSIAMDGVAIVVHPSNNVDNLTLEQIEGIFRGDITNWSEVGGNNAGIAVVSREEGSGIRSTFESFANVRDEVASGDSTVWVSAVAPTAVFSSGTGGIIASVSGNENSIGYISAGLVEDAGLKSVSIDGVAFSEAAVRDGSYAFANVFYLGIVEDTISDVARAFVDWIISEEGQTVISQAEFVRAH